MENDILIAEFMEVLYIKSDGFLFTYKPNPNTGDDFLRCQYNSSWDWLMPIVKQIESFGYTVNISSSMVYINGDDGVVVEPINIWDEKPKLEAVYDAALKFIKWYNQNEK